MPSALTTTLFAILGTGLAALAATCLVLWQRVRALTREGGASRVEPSGSVGPPTAPADRPATGHPVARRFDELAGRHRALEARLARIEASATEAAIAIASRPGAARRVDPGGPTLIAVPNLAAPPASTSGAAAELDRRFGPVWALADAGMPAEAIARETGHPAGQVELILGLRRQLPAAGPGPDG